MADWTEEELDKFIEEHRDLLIKNKPTNGHEIKFMTKLQLRVKNFIDLTPYLVKVAIITIIIFIASIFVWYSFLRTDKNKPVIENIVNQFKKDKTKK
jgi:hypothetical protein